MATFALDNLMSQFATDKEAKKSKGLILRAKDKRFQTPLSPQQSCKSQDLQDFSLL